MPVFCQRNSLFDFISIYFIAMGLTPGDKPEVPKLTVIQYFMSWEIFLGVNLLYDLNYSLIKLTEKE